MFRFKIRKIKYDDILLLVALTVITVSSIYIGRKEAFFNSLNGDALVFNNLFHDGFKLNDMYVLTEHSFIIKYPLFILENLIGFNITTHVVFSVLTLVAMNLGMAWLIYYFSGRNKNVTSILIFAMSSIVLFSMTQGYFWGYSALAIRNIEIPLTIFAILALFKQSKLLSVPNSLLVALLALLCLSDKMVLAFIGGATVLYFLIEIFNHRGSRSIVRAFNANRVFYITIIISISLVFLIEAFIRFTDIFLLTATTPMRTTESVPVLLEAVPKFISGILSLFGAHFFAKTIPEALPNLLNGMIMLVAFFATFRLANHYQKIKSPAVKFLLLIIVANLLVFFLLRQTATDRYLAFMPFIMLLLVAYTFRDVQLSLPRRSYTRIGVVIVIVGVFAILANYSRAQHAVMTHENYNDIATPLTQTRDLSDDLRHNNVGLLVGNYWLIHPAKFWYDQKYNGDLKIASAVPLSEDKVGFVRFISRESWRTNPIDYSKDVAFAIRDGDYGETVDIDKAVKDTFGDYKKRLRYENGGITMYIFDRDIRDKLLTE